MLLTTVHHHICKVYASEAHPRWKVNFDAKVNGITDVFQFLLVDLYFVVFLHIEYKYSKYSE